MRAMRFVVISFVLTAFQLRGSERPLFAEMSEGDSVVAIMEIQSCFVHRRVRFQFQKREDSISVSVWNLLDKRFQEGLIGSLNLSNDDIQKLDNAMVLCRTKTGQNDTCSEKVFLAWQKSGVHVEELWLDSWIYGDENSFPLPKILLTVNPR